MPPKLKNGMVSSKQAKLQPNEFSFSACISACLACMLPVSDKARHLPRPRNDIGTGTAGGRSAGIQQVLDVLAFKARGRQRHVPSPT